MEVLRVSYMNLEHKMAPNPTRSFLCLLGTFVLKLVRCSNKGFWVFLSMGKHFNLHRFNSEISQGDINWPYKCESCVHCVLGLLSFGYSSRSLSHAQNYSLDSHTNKLHSDLRRYVYGCNHCWILALYPFSGNLQWKWTWTHLYEHNIDLFWVLFWVKVYDSISQPYRADNWRSDIQHLVAHLLLSWREAPVYRGERG